MNETEQILTDLLNCSRTELYLKHPDLSCQEKQKFLSVIEQRKKGVPLQYILGRCEFFGLEFKIRPGVFIPRPETEILVETAIARTKDEGRRTKDVKILDIGTGSGNIAVSLAKHILNARITALDVSSEAIALAQENAKLNCVQEKIDFVQTDIFSPSAICHLPSAIYDVIVSNPPYIKSADIENLQIEVRHEPRMALEAGKDGLDFYRKIIELSKKILKPSGILLFEIGFGQAPDIRHIIRDYAMLKIVETVRDYSGIERVITVNRKREM